ncbi:MULTISPECIES: hypothetical protein [unclassified Brachybacterium]|uniref:hypothetical protein n=1 Tax=unclassified Brachybacterium TaxID=2623841 RepID=UPI003F93215C
MTSIMRRTVRGTAAGLGALAIIVGAAACGGGDAETTDPAVSEEEPAEEEGEPAEEADPAETEEDGGEASTDEGTDSEGDEAAAGEGDDAAAGEGDDATAGEALSEEDLTAVGDRYFEFLQAAAQSDGTAACALILNPLTDEPLEGTVLEQCAIGFEGEAGAEGVDPSMFDALDRSMFEGVDNGDGTAGVSVMGQDGGMTFLKADDGQWYIDGSDYI